MNSSRTLAPRKRRRGNGKADKEGLNENDEISEKD